jgi:hypothetical protein
MRSETSSLAFGTDGAFGGISNGFVVAALNAASAACRGSFGLRVLLEDIVLHPRVADRHKPISSIADTQQPVAAYATLLRPWISFTSVKVMPGLC